VAHVEGVCCRGPVEVERITVVCASFDPPVLPMEWPQVHWVPTVRPCWNGDSASSASNRSDPGRRGLVVHLREPVAPLEHRDARASGRVHGQPVMTLVHERRNRFRPWLPT